MRRRFALKPLTTSQVGAVGVAALVILAALIWFVPYLTLQRPVITGVPAPAALAVLTEFAVSPGESACMGSVAVEPNARTVTFGVRPMKLSGSGPPINVVLNATNYRAVGHLASGYPGGVATVAITPPPRNVIGSVCFVNVGKKKALLAGTDEARKMTRSSPLVIAGKPVEGDIALSFTAGRTE